MIIQTIKHYDNFLLSNMRYLYLIGLICMFVIRNNMFTIMEKEFRISEILKGKGMTQTDLAERIGISRVGLSKAINGNTTIATLRKIATALEVDISELFTPKPTDTITCPKCGTVLEVKERR